MMNADGVFIGQICHIEAAEEGGERFNPNMTNEQRRAASNLMLMCYEHHQVTNDTVKYTVKKLQQMKQDHEKRFSDPERAILKAIVDHTEADIPTVVKSLSRFFSVVGEKSQFLDTAECIEELNAHIAFIKNVPIEVRTMIGAVSMRMAKMRDTAAVRAPSFGMGDTRILVSDLQALKIGSSRAQRFANQLESYSLGDMDEIDTQTGMQPAVRIRDLKSGWSFWFQLAIFCEIAGERMEAFSQDLDFARLDE